MARNIGTVPRLLGWPRERIDARIAELIALLRLDQSAQGGKYPHQLSVGQQQRVGVARALAADPELLLMDEPFGALDPITRDALAAELALIHRRTRKTIVFVTHDLDMALAWRTRSRSCTRGGSGSSRRRATSSSTRPTISCATSSAARTSASSSSACARCRRARPDGARASRRPLRHARRGALGDGGAPRRPVPVRDASGAVTGTVALADVVR